MRCREYCMLDFSICTNKLHRGLNHLLAPHNAQPLTHAADQRRVPGRRDGNS